VTDADYLIEGERVALGPLRRDLAEVYMEALASEFEGSVLAGRLPNAE
jgi:hypothetical protein